MARSVLLKIVALFIAVKDKVVPASVLTLEVSFVPDCGTGLISVA